MQRPVLDARNNSETGFSPGSNLPFQQNQPPAPLSERPMAQNTGNRNPNLFKERAHSFIVSVASLFAKRNQPLPPSLTGVAAPNYDPSTSPFKDIEPGSEPGFFKLSGKDINMFQLWSMIWQRGGMGNVRYYFHFFFCDLTSHLSSERTMAGSLFFRSSIFQNLPYPRSPRLTRKHFFHSNTCIGRMSWKRLKQPRGSSSSSRQRVLLQMSLPQLACHNAVPACPLLLHLPFL